MRELNVGFWWRRKVDAPPLLLQLSKLAILDETDLA